jgi:hypothetical protein
MHGNVKFLTPLRKLIDSSQLSLQMVSALTGIDLTRLRRACSGYVELTPEEMADTQRHVALHRAYLAVAAGRIGTDVEDELYKVRGDFANLLLDKFDALHERREREGLGRSTSA